MSKILQSQFSHWAEREEQYSQVELLLKNDPTLAKLNDSAIEEMAKSAKVEAYKVPTLLNSAHTSVDTMRLVVAGHIELVSCSASGEEACIAILGPGSWLTWLGCFEDAPTNHDFYSSSDAATIAIPVKKMRDIAQRYPQLYQIAIHEVSFRFRLLMEWTTESVLLKNEFRVAKLLSLVSRLNAPHGEHTPIVYTQDKLAHLSRCTRQTLSRLLQQLAKQGIITIGYRRIEIVDDEKLSAFILEGMPD
ncbi:Crp/Fnr family transcriptional regulator [Vibrio campbellii]|uniref:Crp/Fnr family transcriptional regulator n=1 Tax=Vibrio campbellii TaxID=680 RepID=UPI000ABE3BC6|nr:Crp/Fnr family transcriptional regulator [Vibrio campbellii]